MKKKSILITSIVVFILLIAGVCTYLFLFTEVFGMKILPTNIESISVSYIPGNMLDCDKKFIKKQEFKLTESEIKKIKPLLKGISKKNYKDKVVGKYDLTINKNVHLYLDKDSSYVVRNKKNTKTSFQNELYDVLDEMIVEKQNKEYYTTINFTNIVLKKDGASITIQNKNNLELLKKYLRFTKIEVLDEDTKTFGDVVLEVRVDNTYVISIFNNNLAGIKDLQKNEFFFAIADEKLFDTANSIYTLSIEKDEKKS